MKNHGYSKNFMDILCQMLEIEDSNRPPIHDLFNTFGRAKSSSNFEPILRGSLNTTGANYHSKNLGKPKESQHVFYSQFI